MKSIKPGRGPSAMNVMGSVFAVIFGIFWTIQAVSMGAPIMFPIFGCFFVITGIVQGLYSYKNATGKNRFSTFDITEGNEEIDPLEQVLFSKENIESEGENKSSAKFCPYCGAGVQDNFEFCPECGKQLP